MDFKVVREKIDALCRLRGVEDYKIVYMARSGMSAKGLGRGLDNTEINGSSVLSLTAVVGGRGGSSSVSSFDDASLNRLVADAADNASVLEGRSECVIYPGGGSYQTLEDSPGRRPSMEALVSKAVELQTSMLDSDKRVLEGSDSVVGSTSVRICLANSKGLALERSFGYEHFWASASVQDGDEANNDSDDGVCPLDEMRIDHCVSGALAKLGARRTATRVCPVVLSQDCAIQILGAFLPVFIGKQATLGLSRLKGREGETIASPCVSLIDDPFEPSSPVKIQFDADGVAAYKKAVVENGVLKTLLWSLSSAKEAGKETTGNAGPYLGTSETGIYSFYLAPGEDSEESLLRKAGDGALFVQEMKGLHAGANPASGDFSIECAGFEIESGRRGQPVKAFTISGNFYDLLKKVAALGGALEWSHPSLVSRIGAPMVLVDSISVAG